MYKHQPPLLGVLALLKHTLSGLHVLQVDRIIEGYFSFRIGKTFFGGLRTVRMALRENK